jgi:phosphotriesterase-related protein
VGAASVQTVLGPIAPADLGITLPHEHLLIDLRPRFIDPPDEAGRALARQPVTMANLAWVRRNYLSSLDNIVLDDEDLAVREARLFGDAGGRTIVDASSIGIRHDPGALQRIARATGLHVIAGTGFYTEDFHAADMSARSEDDLTAEIVRDLETGIGETEVRAGIIGEVGCSWPLHPNERKSLRAAARAQTATRAPISVHPGRNREAPFEVLSILAAAGADVRRVVMGHIERTELDREALLRLAQTGCYLEYDWFGETLSMHPTGPVDVPSDTERIDQLQWLISQGHREQLLASHDVCLKTRLSSYGGGGYGHIVRNVTGWMRAKGMGDSDIDAILVANPRRMLAGA